MPAATAAAAADPEATIIHALLALVGGGRLAVAWALHEPLGAEATVALVFVLLGVVGLVRGWLRR